MGWVNLNDVYLSKSGGTMKGALTVSNNLTVSGTLNGGGIVTSYGTTSGAVTTKQNKKIYTGSIVTKGAGDTAVLLWGTAAFKNAFGKTFTPSEGDIAVFMNGDASNGTDAHIDGSTYTSGGLYAVFDREVSTTMNVRVNYLIVLQQS